RELGGRLGVRQQQIARWESTSYRSAPLERVDAAARALGLEFVAAPAVADSALLAAESSGAYGTTAISGVAPVRDLGEVAARIRANGDVFRDRYHLARIGVFGSFVYGEQTAGSDVDLLVETQDPGGFRFIEAADFAETVLGRHVDFIRPHLLRERLRDRVLREALYVWSA
ncbi:MAG TPA: nucleotidyltransferase domain-containing protein, partial [Coriobacteriia bacterium]